MLKYHLLVSICFIFHFLPAQIPVKIPNKVQVPGNNPFGKTINSDMQYEIQKKAKEKIIEERWKRMQERRKDFDDVDFNYAISFSDNAGLFETKEKGDFLKGTLKEGLDVALKNIDITDENNVTLPEMDIEENAKKLNATGEVFFASGKYRAAEIAFMRSIRNYETLNKLKTATGVIPISNLALLYHTTARYNKADSLTQYALTIRESSAKGEPEHIVSINNKAVLYKDMGRYNEAETLIAEALSLITEKPGKNSIAYALALNNQAMLYQAVGRNQEAEKLIKECLEIAKITLKENSNNYIKLTINLAHLYQNTGKYDEAEKVYLEAIRLKEKKLGKSHPDYAHLKSGLAALYIEMGKTENVEALLKEAVDIYKKKLKEEHPSYAAAISDLGNFYRVNNRLAEAEPLLLKALEVRKDKLGQNHPDYINSLEDYAILCWQQFNIKEAAENYIKVITATLNYIDAYFAPMSESEKSKFWSKMTPRFHRFYSFCADAGKTNPELIALMYDNQLRTKALLLNSSNKVRKQILTSGNSQLISKYTRWIDQKENLARLYTLSKEELAEENINLDSLENVTNNLEKELSSESEIFSKGFDKKRTSFRDISLALKPEEAAVEIVQFRKFHKTFSDSIYYMALVVINTTISSPAYALFRNGHEMETVYFKDYRSGIERMKDSELAYPKFWEQINDLIKDKKTIYVSPDGIYNQISLYTIKEPSGKYIIDSKKIILVGNSKEIIEGKKSSGKNANTQKSATLVGYPKYGTLGKFSELPGTKKEVEAIGKILVAGGYKTTSYTEEKASEEKVKEANTQILHIATHGFFLPEIKNTDAGKILGIETSKAKENPLHRSGLLLAGAENVFTGGSERSTSNNGILTAYEAMNMSLENTELVVLSACETGLGDVKVGEGVYGLQRSFFVAGANAVIMSLWTVSDDATVDLMVNFYKNYAATGNKQESFLKAQKQLKLKYPQPDFWGAFVLIGN